MANKENQPKIKNIKISDKTHQMLKKHCRKNGLKMFAFIELLIKEHCKPTPDIYGEQNYLTTISWKLIHAGSVGTNLTILTSTESLGLTIAGGYLGTISGPETKTPLIQIV